MGMEAVGLPFEAACRFSSIRVGCDSVGSCLSDVRFSWHVPGRYCVSALRVFFPFFAWIFLPLALVLLALEDTRMKSLNKDSVFPS